MSKQATITVEQLHNLRACEDQVTEFIAVWGRSVVVTEEEFVKHAKQFDWAWAASHLLAHPGSNLSDRMYDEWEKLLKPTQKARQVALQALREERTAAENRASGQEAKEIAWDGGLKKLREAQQEWDLKLNEAQARAFAKLYIKKETEDGNATAAPGAEAGSTPHEEVEPTRDTNHEGDESHEDGLEIGSLDGGDMGIDNGAVATPDAPHSDEG